MNNLKFFNDYINEELGWFGSEYSGLINKICKRVRKIDLAEIRQGGFFPNNYFKCYRFIIKGRKMDNDPYGEETSDEDVIIDVGVDDDRLWVNGDLIPAKTSEIEKIRNIIEKRFQNREKDELNQRISKVINKI